MKKQLNLADFKNPHSGGFQAMFLDGSIRFIKSQTPANRIRTLLSIAGDEEIQEEAIEFDQAIPSTEWGR